MKKQEVINMIATLVVGLIFISSIQQEKYSIYISIFFGVLFVIGIFVVLPDKK